MRAIARSILHGALTRALTDPGVGGGTLTQQVIARLTALGGWAWDASAESVGTNYQQAARTNLVTTASQTLGSVTDITGKGLHLAPSIAGNSPVWDGTGCLHASGKWLLTANVDCTGTDTIWACASIIKSSDVSGTADCELGGSNGGAAPGVSIRSPAYSSGAGFGVVSKGSGAVAAANDAPAYPAPQQRVVSALGSVYRDACVLSVDNVVTAIATTDQGGGNFGNAPFYVGAGLNGTNLYFGGKWIRRVVTLFEPSEADKLLFQRWCAEPVSITIPLNYVVAAMGDSYTRVPSGTIAQAWPALVDAQVSQIIWTENLGLSGNTTSNMMARRWQMLRAGTPNIGYLYGAQNDVPTTVAASPTPTATGCTLTSAAGHDVGGWITIGGVQTQVLTVVGNAITYPSLAGGAPAALAAVTIDTQKNLTELALYLKAAGCSRVLIIGKHYSNTSGGDTVSVQQPANAAMRVKQQAAATASGSVYVDVYAQGCSRINGGFNAQGDALWHVSSSDDHLSLAGSTDLVMPAVKAAIIAQGWA